MTHWVRGNVCWNRKNTLRAHMSERCPVTRCVCVRNRMLDLGSGVIMETWQRPRASICQSTLENEYAIMWNGKLWPVSQNAAEYAAWVFWVRNLGVSVRYGNRGTWHALPYDLITLRSARNWNSLYKRTFKNTFSLLPTQGRSGCLPLETRFLRTKFQELA